MKGTCLLLCLVLSVSAKSLSQTEEVDSQGQDASSQYALLTRHRRQSSLQAMDLASRHEDRSGVPRPVGKPHGQVDLRGIANDRKNFHAQGGVGTGAVLLRKGGHSLGAGVYVGQSRGSYQGYNYKSKPDVGFGLGYKWKF